MSSTWRPRLRSIVRDFLFGDRSWLGIHYRVQAIFERPGNDRRLLDRLYLSLMVPRMLRGIAREGGFLPAETKVGPNLRLDHGFNGIVISGAAEIGADCFILQNVTIGNNVNRPDEAPKVGNNVIIGANAVLVGRCVIGDGAKIGAGVVLVNATVPPGATIVKPLGL